MSKDTIYREDAIKAIWGDDINPSEDGIVFEAQSHIDRDIRLIPSADRPQEWIPCSERMPRPYTEVLVCDECGWISMGLYRPCDVTEKDSGWSTLTGIKIPTVGILAWMPLPQPWKGASR